MKNKPYQKILTCRTDQWNFGRSLLRKISKLLVITIITIKQLDTIFGIEKSFEIFDIFSYPLKLISILF